MSDWTMEREPRKEMEEPNSVPSPVRPSFFTPRMRALRANLEWLRPCCCGDFCIKKRKSESSFEKQVVWWNYVSLHSSSYERECAYSSIRLSSRRVVTCEINSWMKPLRFCAAESRRVGQTKDFLKAFIKAVLLNTTESNGLKFLR